MARTIEEIRKAKREAMAKRRAQDPQAARKKQKEWHEKNRDRQIAKLRAYYARRFFWGRAMKLRGDGRATFRDLAKMRKAQRGICALTGKRLDRTAQLDHIIPKARGGSDGKENLRWVTNEANTAKRDMTDVEFLALCKSVMAWLGATDAHP